MKISEVAAALCALFSTTVFAGHPAYPVSSEGYQSIFLGITTESDERYINKSITPMNDDLSMIAMGNTGLTHYLTQGKPGDYGWNEETGVLAQKRTILGGSLNWQDLQYEWVPMKFRVQGDHWGGPMELPSTGLAAAYFPPYSFSGGVRMRNDDIQGPSFDPPKLAADSENYIGLKDGNGEVTSKWYACDDGKYATALSWSLDDTAAKDSACVLVKLRKVNNVIEWVDLCSFEII